MTDAAYDGSVGLSCPSCAKLREALEASKKEHSLTLKIVKEKIISTDELIRKYQQKCLESEKNLQQATDLTVKLEAAEMKIDGLQGKLETSLQSTEPLRKNVTRLHREKCMADSTISELTKKVQNLENLNAELMSTLKLKEEQEMTCRLEKQAHAQEVQKQKKSLEKNVTSITKLQEQLKKEKEKNKEINKSLAHANRRIRTLDQQLQKSKEEVERAKIDSDLAKALDEDIGHTEKTPKTRQKRKSQPTRSCKETNSDALEVLHPNQHMVNVIEELKELSDTGLALSPLPLSPDRETIESSSYSEGSGVDIGSEDHGKTSDDGESDSSLGDIADMIIGKDTEFGESVASPEGTATNSAIVDEESAKISEVSMSINNSADNKKTEHEESLTEHAQNELKTSENDESDILNETEETVSESSAVDEAKYKRDLDVNVKTEDTSEVSKFTTVQWKGNRRAIAPASRVMTRSRTKAMKLSISSDGDSSTENDARKDVNSSQVLSPKYVASDTELEHYLKTKKGSKLVTMANDCEVVKLREDYQELAAEEISLVTDAVHRHTKVEGYSDASLSSLHKEIDNESISDIAKSAVELDTTINNNGTPSSNPCNASSKNEDISTITDTTITNNIGDINASSTVARNDEMTKNIVTTFSNSNDDNNASSTITNNVSMTQNIVTAISHDNDDKNDCSTITENDDMTKNVVTTISNNNDDNIASSIITNNDSMAKNIVTTLSNDNDDNGASSTITNNDRMAENIFTTISNENDDNKSSSIITNNDRMAENIVTTISNENDDNNSSSIITNNDSIAKSIFSTISSNNDDNNASSPITNNDGIANNVVTTINKNNDDNNASSTMPNHDSMAQNIVATISNSNGDNDAINTITNSDSIAQNIVTTTSNNNDDSNASDTTSCVDYMTRNIVTTFSITNGDGITKGIVTSMTNNDDNNSASTMSDNDATTNFVSSVTNNRENSKSKSGFQNSDLAKAKMGQNEDIDKKSSYDLSNNAESTSVFRNNTALVGKLKEEVSPPDVNKLKEEVSTPDINKSSVCENLYESELQTKGIILEQKEQTRVKNDSGTPKNIEDNIGISEGDYENIGISKDVEYVVVIPKEAEGNVGIPEDGEKNNRIPEGGYCIFQIPENDEDNIGIFEDVDDSIKIPEDPEDIMTILEHRDDKIGISENVADNMGIPDDGGESPETLEFDSASAMSVADDWDLFGQNKLHLRELDLVTSCEPEISFSKHSSFVKERKTPEEVTLPIHEEGIKSPAKEKPGQIFSAGCVNDNHATVPTTAVRSHRENSFSALDEDVFICSSPMLSSKTLKNSISGVESPTNNFNYNSALTRTEHTVSSLMAPSDQIQKGGISINTLKRGMISDTFDNEMDCLVKGKRTELWRAKNAQDENMKDFYPVTTQEAKESLIFNEDRKCVGVQSDIPIVEATGIVIQETSVPLLYVLGTKSELQENESLKVPHEVDSQEKARMNTNLTDDLSINVLIDNLRVAIGDQFSTLSPLPPSPCSSVEETLGVSPVEDFIMDFPPLSPLPPSPCSFVEECSPDPSTSLTDFRKQTQGNVDNAEEICASTHTQHQQLVSNYTCTYTKSIRRISRINQSEHVIKSDSRDLLDKNASIERKTTMLKPSFVDERKSHKRPIQPYISGSTTGDNTVSQCKKIKTSNQTQETSSVLAGLRAKSSVNSSASKGDIIEKQFKQRSKNINSNQGLTLANKIQQPLTNITANNMSAIKNARANNLTNSTELRDDKYRPLLARPKFLSESQYVERCLKRLSDDNVELTVLVERLTSNKCLSSCTILTSAVVQFLKKRQDDLMPDILNQLRVIHPDAGAVNWNPVESGFETRLLDLLTQLRDSGTIFGNVFSQMVTLCSQSLITSCCHSRSGNFKGALSLSRVLTSCCQIQENLDCIRVICYDVMRLLHKYQRAALEVIVSMVTVWPEVLKTSSSCSDDQRLPLVRTLKMVLSYWGNSATDLGDILRVVLTWKGELVTQETVKDFGMQLTKCLHDDTMASICLGKDWSLVADRRSFELAKSLELLTCVLDWPWTVNELIINNIWIILNDWIDKEPLLKEHDANSIASGTQNEILGTGQSVLTIKSSICCCETPSKVNEAKAQELSSSGTAREICSNCGNLTVDKLPESQVLLCIQLLGRLCRIAIENEQNSVPEVLELLYGVMEETSHPKVTYAIQLAAAISLLEVSPWQPERVITVLSKWLEELKNSGSHQDPAYVTQGLVCLASVMKSKQTDSLH